MKKALITALGLTCLATLGLAQPAFASKKHHNCSSKLTYCIKKSKSCSDMKECRDGCLTQYDYCTGHDHKTIPSSGDMPAPKEPPHETQEN